MWKKLNTGDMDSGMDTGDMDTGMDTGDMDMGMVMATGMDTMANPDMVVLLRQRKMKVKQARIRQKHF